MGRRRRFLVIESLWCALVLASSPLAVFADQTVPATIEPEAVVLAPVLINEVQTAMPLTGNASKEFIELYNTTNQPIDLSDWQLWYVSATSTNFDQPTRRIPFAASEAGPQIIGSKDYYLLSGHVDYLVDLRNLTYDATLATNGSLRLVHKSDDYLETCQLINEDTVNWGTTDPIIRGPAAEAPAAGSSIERARTTGGLYIDTDDASVDFVSNPVPTPAAQNSATASTLSLPVTPLTLPDPTCTPQPTPEPTSDPVPGPTPEEPAPDPGPPIESPPSTTEPAPDPVESTDDPLPEEEEEEEEDVAPTIPVANHGLKTPQLSELLPNPAAPQTDANDEFIELYNPNDAAFDLSGYTLETGITTVHRYTFPPATSLPGKSFLAVFSADSGLTLSNTAGQARLVDPLGSILAQSDEYAAAKDGQSWLLANGSWQWATKPTPNAVNVVSAPVVKKTVAAKVSAASTTKKTTTKSPTAKKTGTTKTSKTTAAKSSGTAQEDATQTVATAPKPRSPLHPGVLAVVAASALLYGAYEYRHDVANKFAKFRDNRAARAAFRQGAKGR